MQTAEGRLSDERGYIFVVVLGLFIGSLIGAMAQIVPYSLVLLSAMGVSVLAWRQEGSLSSIVIMLGLLFGSLFGNMASVMPWGVTVYLAMILAMMIWKTQGSPAQGPTTQIAMILFIISSVGFLFNGTFQDFCNPTFIGTDVCLHPSASGYITAWQGCSSTCTITAFTFLGNSPLAFLATGNFVGFLSSLISGTQSPFTFGSTATAQCNLMSSLLCFVGAPTFWSVVASIVTAAAGVICLFLGTGVGLSGSGQIVSTGIGGAITPNSQGTRLFQALGIGWLLWAAVTGLVFNFGQMFSYIGFGLGSNLGVAGGGVLYVTFLAVYTYMLYEQSRIITA